MGVGDDDCLVWFGFLGGEYGSIYYMSGALPLARKNFANPAGVRKRCYRHLPPDPRMKLRLVGGDLSNVGVDDGEVYKQAGNSQLAVVSKKRGDGLIGRVVC